MRSCVDDELGLVTQPERPVTIRPSRVKPSELARREAEEINTIHANRLDRARKQAEGWGTGAAAMLGLIATLSVVEGPDSVEGIASLGQLAIGLCLLLALLFGVVALTRFTRAAYGRIEPIALKGEPGLRLDLWRQEQYQQARDDVTVGMRATYAVIGLAVLAVALSWVLPR